MTVMLLSVINLHVKLIIINKMRPGSACAKKGGCRRPGNSGSGYCKPPVSTESTKELDRRLSEAMTARAEMDAKLFSNFTPESIAGTQQGRG
jgi:hypothetical protein